MFAWSDKKAHKYKLHIYLKLFLLTRRWLRGKKMPEEVEEVQIAHGEAAQRTVTGISTLDILREGVKKNNRVF